MALHLPYKGRGGKGMKVKIPYTYFLDLLLCDLRPFIVLLEQHGKIQIPGQRIAGHGKRKKYEVTEVTRL